jgi:transposase
VRELRVRGARLCQAEKPALTACMRKRLTILNAMVKRGTPWQVTASQRT